MSRRPAVVLGFQACGQATVQCEAPVGAVAFVLVIVLGGDVKLVMSCTIPGRWE